MYSSTRVSLLWKILKQSATLKIDLLNELKGTKTYDEQNRREDVVPNGGRCTAHLKNLE
jgi:hypothetical protein